MANHVYSIDPWWNNAMEDQAFGRALRLGQEKTVHRYRVMASGTVDVKIELLQRRKAENVSLAMRDDKRYTAKLSNGNLEFLLQNESVISGDTGAGAEDSPDEDTCNDDACDDDGDDDYSPPGAERRSRRPFFATQNTPQKRRKLSSNN